MKECTGEAKEKEGEFDEMANSSGAAQKEFIFIRLPVLREVSAVCGVCMCVCVCVCVCVSACGINTEVRVPSVYNHFLYCSIWSESFALMVCLFHLIWR